MMYASDRTALAPRDTREDAIERDADSRANDLQAEAYEWLRTRFGEDAACALVPDTWVDPNPAATVAAARTHFTQWCNAEAWRQAEQDREERAIDAAEYAMEDR